VQAEDDLQRRVRDLLIVRARLGLFGPNPNDTQHEAVGRCRRARSVAANPS